MRRTMPLLASTLFLLLLNLVHALSLPTHGPTLDERGFYSNRNDSLVDHRNATDNTPTKTATESSSTVKTIYIRESNGHTYHELGGSYGSPTASSSVNDPNESNIEAQVNQDTAVLHRLITITTVVGGVGVGLLVTGTLIYIRLRTKRKRMKAEMNLYHNNGSFTSYLSNITDINNRRRRKRQQNQHDHNNNDHNNNNNDDDNNNSTNNNNNNHYSQQHQPHLLPTNTVGSSSPSSSLSTSTSNLPINPAFQESIEMNLIPSAPPEPILLNEQIRSRRQISMISQQQAFTEPISSPSLSVLPLPSAPSAKELMMDQPSSSSPHPSPSRLYHRRNVSLSTSVNTNTILPPRLIVNHYDTPSSSYTSPISSSSHPLHLSRSTSHRQQQPDLLKPTTIHEDELQDRSPVTPDIPPPAYTPSAPPLFILPPSQRRRSADEISLDRYRH